MIDPEEPIGGTELERALLEAGRSYRSSRRARTRTMMALGLAGSTVGLAGAAGASWLIRVVPAAVARAISAAGGTKLVVAVSIAAAGIPIGYHAWHRFAAPAAPLATPAPAAAPPPAAPAPLATPPAAPVIALAAAATSGVAEAPRAALGRGAREASLKVELTRLDEARGALAGGDARRALALLDAYTRAYPHGSLELEAEILRMDALAQDGHRDGARRRAQVFLRRHPKSVLAARARGFLAPDDN
jgi:hypothetical protein